jgi:hypothetical protein
MLIRRAAEQALAFDAEDNSGYILCFEQDLN